MRLANRKSTNWKEIDSILLNINSIELIFEDYLELKVDCSFENISKGRCSLSIKEKGKKDFNNLFVHTDKALMVVNLFYKQESIKKLVDFFSSKKNNSKKIKVEIKIIDSLMINESGYLYIKDNLNLKISSVCWNIPII